MIKSPEVFLDRNTVHVFQKFSWRLKAPMYCLSTVKKEKKGSGGGRVLSLAASCKVSCPIGGHPTHRAGAAALFFIAGPRGVRLFLHGHDNHGTTIILLRRGNKRRGSPGEGSGHFGLHPAALFHEASAILAFAYWSSLSASASSLSSWSWASSSASAASAYM